MSVEVVVCAVADAPIVASRTAEKIHFFIVVVILLLLFLLIDMLILTELRTGGSLL